MRRIGLRNRPYCSSSDVSYPMMALGVQVVVFLLGVAVFANYAWHIFSAKEEDWRESKRAESNEEDR